MGQHALRQHLAQLYAFLVKAVQVPEESLEHHLVLEVGKQRTQRFRRQFLADNDAGGAVPGEVLVPVFVLLAAGKSHDLSRHVGAQLLLAGAALNHNVRFRLALLKADELQRDDIRSLVKQLIEGMLSVGAGFAEDHRPCHINHRLAEAVHALAVGFHVKLLQMGREPAQRLAVGQHRRAGIAQNVPLVNADQRVQHRRVFQRILFRCQFVFLRGALQEPVKDFRSEGQRQHCAAHGGCGRIAAADIVIHEEGRQIVAALRQG